MRHANRHSERGGLIQSIRLYHRPLHHIVQPFLAELAKRRKGRVGPSLFRGLSRRVADLAGHLGPRCPMCSEGWRLPSLIDDPGRRSRSSCSPTTCCVSSTHEPHRQMANNRKRLAISLWRVWDRLPPAVSGQHATSSNRLAELGQRKRSCFRCGRNSRLAGTNRSGA
jgi:hypothetical protein